MYMYADSTGHSSMLQLLHASSTVCIKYCMCQVLYCMHQVLHAPSTVCTKYCMHQVLYVPSTVCTKYCMHQVLCAQSTACTKYCMCQVLHAPSTVCAKYCVHQVLYKLRTKLLPQARSAGYSLRCWKMLLVGETCPWGSFGHQNRTVRS